MLELKKIDIMSLAKIVAIIGAVLGFIFGILVALIASIAPGTTYAALGALAIILFPILYAIIGFIGGALTALVYNVIAERIGGVQLDLQTVGYESRKQKIKELYEKS